MLVAFVIGSAVLSAAPASAVTLTVNSVGDAADADLFDNVCDTGASVGSDPECTLRAALDQLSQVFGPTTIVFDPALGSGPLVIQVGVALPRLAGFETVLDGYSVPGSSENTLPSGWDGVVGVVIDGGSIPGTDPQVVLTIGAGGKAQGVAVINSGGRAGLVGIQLDGVGAALRGALVGTDLVGATTEGFDVGVRIAGSTTTQDVAIGGPLPGDRNLISGNGIGVLVKPSFGNLGGNQLIEGNYIGTAGPNGTGVRFEGVKAFGGHRIGGPVPDPADPGPRNVISGNTGNGVEIHDSNNISILGNRIGVGPVGLPFANGGNGVVLTGGSNSIYVGDSFTYTDPTGNEIAHNGLAGVSLVSDPPGADDAGSFNPIDRNSIHSNQGLGIALSDPLVPLANDPGDADAGPNDLLNRPVIVDVVRPDTGASDTVTVRIDGLANTYYQVDVFASPECDASGSGEGKTWLASGTFTTDGAGAGETTFDVSIADGEAVLTATAFAQSATSEFSPCFDARNVMPGTVGFRETEMRVREGDWADCGAPGLRGVCVVVDRLGGAEGDVSVQLEPLADGRQRDPECAVLLLHPAGPDPERETPAAEVVDSERHLGEQRRVSERVGAHQAAEPDPAGGSGRRAEQRPRLEAGSPVHRAAKGRHEVVHRPQARKARSRVQEAPEVDQPAASHPNCGIWIPNRTARLLSRLVPAFARTKHKPVNACFWTLRQSGAIKASIHLPRVSSERGRAMVLSETLHPRKQPAQPRARATVEAILDATARLLTETGVDRLTTNPPRSLPARGPPPRRRNRMVRELKQMLTAYRTAVGEGPPP